MKKLSIAALLVVSVLTACTSTPTERRKIEVSGIAEKEIPPDIINVSVSLKEYFDGKTKITISDLEAKLEKAVKEAGIPKSDFTVNDLSSFNESYYQHKKNPNFLISKGYGIRFHKLDSFNQMMSKLDARGIESTGIDSYDYSKLPEAKRELKIKALQAAKDKAAYLLNSVDEQLGRVIEITENPITEQFRSSYNTMANTAVYDSAMPDKASNINAKTMKLSFQINAVFEIAR